MQFLQFKKTKNANTKFIVLREKKRKFDKKVKETYISKKNNLIIYGLNASGKTKELNKVWNARKEIWNKDKFIKLDAFESLTEWINNNIKTHEKDLFEEENRKMFEEENIDISKEINKQYIKIKILKEKAKNGIIFVDDVDKLTGKKLEIAKDIIRDAKQTIMTATDELSINKTILYLNRKTKTKEINLKTTSSYDATNMLIVIAILGMFVTGQTELAVLIMIARYAMKGKGK